MFGGLIANPSNVAIVFPAEFAKIDCALKLDPYFSDTLSSAKALNVLVKSSKTQYVPSCSL